mgnify:CR=1 FL=1
MEIQNKIVEEFFNTNLNMVDLTNMNYISASAVQYYRYIGILRYVVMKYTYCDTMFGIRYIA